MASAIASIPVLTGDVAEKFETQAQKTYKEYLQRASQHKNKDARYERGVRMVQAILEKSKRKGL